MALAVHHNATRVDLPGARGSRGLYIVAQLHLAFVACEGNDRLLTLNLLTRQVVQSFDDPSTHRAYFPLKNIDGRPVLRVMAPR
ncbi:hypothetical protein OKW42_003371 [Paraburkholderia sp. WC7.3d]